MYRKIPVTLTLCALLALAAPAGAAVYTGELSTEPDADGLLEGAGTWATESTLSWTVDTGGPWVEYAYTLSVADAPGAGISHVSLETSDNLTEAGFRTDWDEADIEFGLLPANAGSPSMPDDLWGIKFEDADGVQVTANGRLSVSWTIESNRQPTWGDFYAKGGQDNELWNAGFGNDPASSPADPGYVPPASGSYAGKLLVPDTLVPEPLSAVLMALATPMLLVKKRR